MPGQSAAASPPEPQRSAAVDPYSYNDASRPERGVDPRAQAAYSQQPPDSRIVAGVRGGGSWTEPGHTGVPLAPPTVPTKLRGSNYEEGVRAFNDEHYDDAIQYFRDFIHQDPQSDRADDAQFWIGESYLRKGMHSNAIKEFNQVVLRYSSGDRSAAERGAARPGSGRRHGHDKAHAGASAGAEAGAGRRHCGAPRLRCRESWFSTFCA